MGNVRCEMECERRANGANGPTTAIDRARWGHFPDGFRAYWTEIRATSGLQATLLLTPARLPVYNTRLR